MLRRNKIKIFAKSKSFSNFSLTFLFIFTFLLIVFNKMDYVLVKKIKSFGVDVITPTTNVISYPAQISANIIKSVNQIRFLKQENSKLKEEIIRLKKWQTLAIKSERENRAYKKLLNSTSNKISVIKTAAVISKSPNIFAKTIVINAGLNENLKEDLPVINERGLVGKVISSTNENSKIILINDQNSSIPVKTLSKKFNAIIKGTVDGKYLTSSFIKEKNKIKVGDILVTSGSAKIFPQDILVGKVIKVEENNFFALPYVDFQNLNFVQIIETD